MSTVRVLWLAKGLGRGGAEMLLVSLARAMDSEAVELEVAYVLPLKDALVERLRSEGVVVRLLGSGSPVSWVPALRKLLASGGFDVVHTHAPVIGAAARVLAPRATVMAHTEHNVWGRYRRLSRWANAVTLGRNTQVWAVSEGVAGSIRDWRPRSRRAPVKVMLHGVDPLEARRGPEARTEALAKLGMHDGPFTVGTVGNLTPKKDHDTLLQAFARLRRHHGDARLLIIGTGPREQHLRSLIRQLRLEDSVRLLGLRDDVLEILPALDVFALSSLHEGLSIALIEALATGLPVVATRVGGIPEVIADGRDGLLVPPASPDALHEAIERIVNDPDLRRRLGDRATARAAEFGIKNAAHTLTREYGEMAGRGRRRMEAPA